MATLKELRDQVIIDAGIEGQPKFPIPRLNRMINIAQRYVQTNLNGLGMKKWETSSGLILLPRSFAGQSVLISELSSNCPNMLESPNSIIFIETTSDPGQNGLAYPVSVDKFLEQLKNTYLAPTYSNPVFMRLANRIYLAPISILEATAYYYKAVADLTADSSQTEIPIEFEEFIIKKTVLDINDILGKIESKELAQRQIEKEMFNVYEKFLSKQAELQRIKNNDNAKLQ